MTSAGAQPGTAERVCVCGGGGVVGEGAPSPFFEGDGVGRVMLHCSGSGRQQ